MRPNGICFNACYKYQYVLLIIRKSYSLVNVLNGVRGNLKQPVAAKTSETPRGSDTSGISNSVMCM